MAYITTRKPYVPLKRLRRLAPRGLRVVERYRSLDPTLEVLAPDFVKAATEFEDAYDKPVLMTRAQKFQQSRDCLEALRGKTVRWLAVLSRDRPEHAAGLRTLPRTADEVISTAKRVVTTVRDLQDREVSPLPYADRLIESLSQAIDETQTQLDEARNAAADAQEHAQRIRDAATALQAELVSLRKVLRSLLGSRHVDYQTLRSERGAYHEDEEETEVSVQVHSGEATARAEASRPDGEDAPVADQARAEAEQVGPTRVGPRA